jgi:anti-sigma factor RsiW
MTELSDELLIAYVGGRLEGKQTSAVEKVLEQDDVVARRVETFKIAHSRLEAAFEAILAGEEMELAGEPPPARPGIWIEWRVAKVLAGIAAAILIIALAIIV